MNHSSQNIIAVYNNQNVYDIFAMQQPYRPLKSAILLFKSGVVQLEENTRPLELKPHSILLVDKNKVYEILSIKGELDILSIAYDQEFTEKINIKLNKFNLYDGLRTQLYSNYQIPKKDFALLWKQANCMKDYFEYHAQLLHIDDIIQSQFAVLVYHLASVLEKFKEATKGMTSSQSTVFQFMHLVSEYYLQTIDSAFYANKLSISSRHLNRILVQEIQKSASDVLMDFIINEAKIVLTTKQDTIKSIAEKLHFSDQYAFSHFFKRKTGLSPIHYRQQFL